MEGFKSQAHGKGAKTKIGRKLYANKQVFGTRGTRGNTIHQDAISHGDYTAGYRCQADRNVLRSSPTLGIAYHGVELEKFTRCDLTVTITRGIAEAIAFHG